jgi:hypothetical protein
VTMSSFETLGLGMRTGNILGFSAIRYSCPKGPVHCACRWKWMRQEHCIGIVGAISRCL